MGCDDQLYAAAYGDGQGVDPQVLEKLSLGFASIEGPASEFYGTNIEYENAEKGDGRVGKKASSLLIIEDTLYMWVRNVDANGQECQLAWSDTEATTWEWIDWTFPEFGYCVFVQYGVDYEGSRDDVCVHRIARWSKCIRPTCSLHHDACLCGATN